MSYKMILVKSKMVELLLNNTVSTVDSAYNTVIDDLKITLSSTEKNTVKSEVIANIIHC